MTIAFLPTAGQVALIESLEPSPAGGSLTGVVSIGREGKLNVIGVPRSQLADGAEVLVSIFAPDALYRIQATARWGLSGRLAISPIHEIERVQRRRWPRHPLQLDVTLGSLDGPDSDFAGISGRTLDLGVGGLRVETAGRLPPGVDATVVLTMPDGLPLMARTTVVCADITAQGCEYRLVFDHLDETDANRLTALVGQAGDSGVL